MTNIESVILSKEDISLKELKTILGYLEECPVASPSSLRVLIDKSDVNIYPLDDKRTSWGDFQKVKEASIGLNEKGIYIQSVRDRIVYYFHTEPKE